MTMILYIALCDKKGKVNKVIRSAPISLLGEGESVRTLFSEPKEADRLLKESAQRPVKAGLLTKQGGERPVFVSAGTFGKQVLFMMYGLDEEQEFPELTGVIFSLIRELGVVQEEPYELSYYEIQKVNNQLINSQRDLAKANERMKELLEEARKSKSTIELLERDPLTNLYNQKAFYAKAAAKLEENPAQDFDMVVVDIERFKLVNDIFGVAEGDKLLVRLTNCLLNLPAKERPLIARATADKFFLMLLRDDCCYEQLEQMMEVLAKEDPLPMQIQIKFGIYQIIDRELEIATMCDRASLAADSVKGMFDVSYAFYDDSLREKLLVEQRIVNTMTAALENDEFQVYLQPKVELSTGRLVGAEALVRWIHPEFGFMSPAEFIPVFEKNGFISNMDFYVWEKTCELMERWKSGGGDCVPISVNVSRIDVYNTDLPVIFADLIKRHRLSQGDLHLEITESAYVEDSLQIVSAVNKLKSQGFAIEMDDFGTGYSSLNILSELPINTLKMDLGFLKPGENADLRKTIMRFVIQLAEELHLQVIAEGVETEEQANLLKEMGCRYGQGYYYGRPMPPEEFASRYGLSHSLSNEQ